MKENKLIAEFMGYEEQDMSFRIPKHILKIEQENDCPNSQDLDCWDVPLKSLQFHKSWDWLMPVVIECFERFGNTDNIDYMRLNDALLTCNIDELYNEVVEFINQYNKTK